MRKMQKQTWLIVVAFIAGWIIAPLTDPPVGVERVEVFVASTNADDAASVRLASR